MDCRLRDHGTTDRLTWWVSLPRDREGQAMQAGKNLLGLLPKPFGILGLQIV